MIVGVLISGWGPNFGSFGKYSEVGLLDQVAVCF